MRLLFARIGNQYCYQCNGSIENQTVQQIVDYILQHEKNSKLFILSPIVINKKGQHKETLKMIAQQGFTRVRVNGEIKELHNAIVLNKNKKHNIDVLVDRLVISKKIIQRLTESIELALTIGDGILIIKHIDGEEYLFI